MNVREEAWVEYQRKRFMRPDAHRWMRPDADRLMGPNAADLGPDAMAAAIEQRGLTAVDLRELKEAWHHLMRARKMLAEIKSELSLRAWRPRALGGEPAYLRQPRVPRGNPDGGQWTSGDGGSDAGADDDRATVQPAYLAPGLEAARAGITATLAFFTWLSGRNNADQQAIVTFRAREFAIGGTLEAESVGALSKNDAEAACPRLPEVQERTNYAAAAFSRDGMTAQQYGTAVHMRLRDDINGLRDGDFRAEESFLKAQAEVRYGSKDSVRVDVFENVRNGTVCVYDIKTGSAVLYPSRMREIAGNVLSRYPQTTRLVVTEIRPR